MIVCENCFRAIESREGNIKHTHYYYDDWCDEDEPAKQCEWCNEDFADGQDVYEI